MCSSAISGSGSLSFIWRHLVKSCGSSGPRPVAGGGIEEQDGLGARRGKQLPGQRRRGRFLAAEALGEFFGVVVQLAPGLDETLARHQPLHGRDVAVAQAVGKEVHHRRRRVQRVAQVQHLLLGLEQLRERRGIHLARRPVRVEHLQPAFLLVQAKQVQGVVLVGDLLDLVADGAVGDVVDVIALRAASKRAWVRSSSAKWKRAVKRVDRISREGSS